MMDELVRVTEFFKVLGDTTRLRIMYEISDKELCVCDIANALNMTQSAISHQLRILKQSHLVKNRREGKSIFYSLDDSHISSILEQAKEHVNEG